MNGHDPAAMSGLDRFVEAQSTTYATALAELRQGDKRSHWMWFVFPQLARLGRSPTAQFYAIRSVEEAAAYLAHPTLGARYAECVDALQDLPVSDPVTVFGAIDALKLRSSLTLFEAVAPQPRFGAVLDRWFDGERDAATLGLLAAFDRPDRSPRS